METKANGELPTTRYGRRPSQVRLAEAQAKMKYRQLSSRPDCANRYFKAAKHLRGLLSAGPMTVRDCAALMAEAGFPVCIVFSFRGPQTGLMGGTRLRRLAGVRSLQRDGEFQWELLK